MFVIKVFHCATQEFIAISKPLEEEVCDTLMETYAKVSDKEWGYITFTDNAGEIAVISKYILEQSVLFIEEVES